jgi:hypothetical protein
MQFIAGEKKKQVSYKTQVPYEQMFFPMQPGHVPPLQKTSVHKAPARGSDTRLNGPL